MWERLPEFVGNHPYLSLTFAGLVATLFYTEISQRLRRYIAVTPSQLTLLINRKNAVVLDVRANSDFDRGHIVSARHYTPSQIDPESKGLAKLREQALAVYCKNGTVSQQVCQKLSKAGFTQVHWLQGGIQAWVGDQLPVTSGK